MHFARVLRAAGLPIGPDRVIDALRALEVAGLERRDDFYWTLASVFLDRREQFEVFDQAFHIFWRDPQLLERVMACSCRRSTAAAPGGQPAAGDRVCRGAPAGTQSSSRSPATPSRRRSSRRDPHLFRARSAAARRLRDHDRRGTRAGEEADRPPAPADSRGPHAPLPPRRRGRARRPARRRCARACARAAQIIPLKRRSRAVPPSAAGGAVRHLRQHEPLLAHVPAFPACDHQRPRPRAHLRVRHAAHQHHPLPAPPRRRRRHDRGGRRSSQTGRAARASAPACTSSTCAGRGACWARTRWCC